MLVEKQIGHTYDDIDTSFKRWSMHLCKKDYPIILLLVKSYMHMEKVVTILHKIKEHPT